MDQPLMRTLEWLRLPGDMVFILAGVLPAVLAALTAWRFRNHSFRSYADYMQTPEFEQSLEELIKNNYGRVMRSGMTA
jgi:hypothetical protein